MLKLIHSYAAYAVLILVVISVVNAVIGLLQRKKFTGKDRKLGLFTLIAVHTQFLIGIAWLLYTYIGNIDMSEVMKIPSLRLIIVEHPLMMLIGAILVTIGWSKHKKRISDTGKFRAFAIFYGLTLIIFLSRIPWAQWLA